MNEQTIAIAIGVSIMTQQSCFKIIAS